MKRPRPYVPKSVRLEAALRQWARQGCVDANCRSWIEAGSTLTMRLRRVLSLIFADQFETLHLDHDPPLRVRAFNQRTGKYTPDANDPSHLVFRTAAEHRLKTNVRGDGAQYPDRVLIKRERRRESPKPKRKYRWPKRPLRSQRRSAR